MNSPHWFLITYAFLGSLIHGEVIPNQCFICFKKETSNIERSLVENKYSLTLKNTFFLTRARLYQTNLSEPITKLLEKIRTEKCVEYADYNHLKQTQAFQIDEPRFPDQWYLKNEGETVNFRQAKSGADIDWDKAMENYNPRAKRVVVSVIDTGISADHPEIKDRRAYMPAELNGMDGVDDDGIGYIDDTHGWDFIENDNDPADLNGHGTQVAGILASHTDNLLGVSGVAPNAFILPMRVFNEYGGGATDDRILSALGYSILGGVRIINLSLGKGSAFSIPIQDALYNLEENFDVLMICAAGNGGPDGRGDDLEETSFYPASYLGKVILSVAATDENDELAIFSNYGSQTVDIAAPGVNMLTPDLSRKTIEEENFDGELSGWSVTGSENGSFWEKMIDPSGNQWITDSAYDNQGFLKDYSYNINLSLQSPLIDLSGTKGASLKIRIYHDLASSFFFFSHDTLWIEASSVESDTWHTIGQVYGRSQRGGALYQFDLSDFDGKSIRIRFRLETDNFRNADGVYLDDLEISGVSSFDKDSAQYAFVSGTSFATPVVSGVAAMLLAHRPELSSLQVREILIKSVRPVDSLVSKVASGGIVNAKNALQEAERTKVFLDRGWHFHQEKWIFSPKDNRWHYLVNDMERVLKWNPDSSPPSWQSATKMKQTGWRYHEWPYAYDPDLQAWLYFMSNQDWVAWKASNQKWHIFDNAIKSWRWKDE